MRRLLFGVIVIIAMQLVSINMMAQQSQPAQAGQNDIRNSIVYRMNVGIFNRALKYNDNVAANNALYNLCVLEPQNDSLLFALAYRYFETQNYLSAALACADVIMLNPNNLTALEVRALSLEQVGAKEKALEEYETLYLKTEDVNTLYKVAVMQFELKRFNECKTNIDILLSKKEVDEIKYFFPIEENKQQEVPLRAALHNLKGLIAKEQGNTVEAKKQFSIALEVFPDFAIAKSNLQELN